MTNQTYLIQKIVSRVVWFPVYITKEFIANPLVIDGLDHIPSNVI